MKKSLLYFLQFAELFSFLHNIVTGFFIVIILQVHFYYSSNFINFINF